MLHITKISSVFNRLKSSYFMSLPNSNYRNPRHFNKMLESELFSSDHLDSMQFLKAQRFYTQDLKDKTKKKSEASKPKTKPRKSPKEQYPFMDNCPTPNNKTPWPPCKE